MRILPYLNPAVHVQFTLLLFFPPLRLLPSEVKYPLLTNPPTNTPLQSSNPLEPPYQWPQTPQLSARAQYPSHHRPAHSVRDEIVNPSPHTPIMIIHSQGPEYPYLNLWFPSWTPLSYQQNNMDIIQLLYRLYWIIHPSIHPLLTPSHANQKPH